jgi:hypothetical protein
MDKEFTAYNLLEFYLLTSIDNRCYPFVATSGNDAIINLNQFLKSDNYGQIQLDEEQYNYVKKIGNPVDYLKTIKQLNICPNKNYLPMNQFNLTLGIILNDLFKQKKQSYIKHKLESTDEDPFILNKLIKK